MFAKNVKWDNKSVNTCEYLKCSMLKVKDNVLPRETIREYVRDFIPTIEYQYIKPCGYVLLKCLNTKYNIQAVL